MSQPLYFTLPESFRAAEFLRSPKFQFCMDDARHFISVVLTKTVRDDVDEMGVVRLRSEYLKNVMNQRHDLDVVQALVDGGAVHRSPYVVGKKSYGFRLADRYIDDPHVRVRVTDPRLIHRLQLFHKKAEAERQEDEKPVHRELKKRQRRLRIHGDRAREKIAELPKSSNRFDAQGILVAEIERGEFRFKVGEKYRRVTNSITSMKRELRQFLHVDGEGLAGVDIACCQPALIARIMARQAEEQTTQAGQGRTTGDAASKPRTKWAAGSSSRTGERSK